MRAPTHAPLTHRYALSCHFRPCNILQRADAAPILLAKVGSGLDSTLAPDLQTMALAMDRRALLEAMAASTGFKESMSGTAHDKCKVFVVVSHEEEGPTDEEEMRRKELKGIKKLGDVYETLRAGGATGANIFIRVELPTPAAAAGETRRSMFS